MMPDMTGVLIGNDFSQDLRDDRGWSGWWVQRLVWFARDHDVLVLPVEPDEAFLTYATSLTGTDRSTLRVVVPPAQDGRADLLTARRLVDAAFREALGQAIDGRRVARVLALWPDPAVAALARALGAAEALPGFGFVDQGGGTLVNSKSAFRALAGGVGVPLPAGAVCGNARAAEDAIVELLDQGHVAIAKHDFLSGGRGNEILSPIDEIRPIGARRALVLDGRPAVRAYVEEHWPWLSGGGRGRVVVERYHRDSSAYFVEFALDEHGNRLAGDGELLSAPFAVGQIMPSPDLPSDVHEALVAGGQQLCEPVRAMGYRGPLSADAIVTPEQAVLFTEFNGRVTGSTHIYGRIGQHVVGAGYGRDRMILERVWPPGWSVDSFASAVRALDAAGLAYDPGTRLGVVLTNAFDDRYNGVMYCIVASALDEAWSFDRQLKQVFGVPRSDRL
jgi:hypothetical protein